MNPPAIVLQALVHTYADGTPALRGVDLCAMPGEALAIVGANGAGKSTLLQHLSGLLMPSSGSVRIEGVALKRATLRDVRRRVGTCSRTPKTSSSCPRYKTTWPSAR